MKRHQNFFIAYSLKTMELCLLIAGLLERHLKVHGIAFLFELVALITARAGAHIHFLTPVQVAMIVNRTDVHEFSKYKLSSYCDFSATLSVR